MKNLELQKKNVIIILSFFTIGLILIFSSSLNTNNAKMELSSVNNSLINESQLVNARNTVNYVPLVDENELIEGSNTSNLPNLLTTLFRWGLSVAVLLSILFVIKGGLQYTITDSISGKASGKETIKGALIGLLLALSSVLILQTINPQLLSLRITSNDGVQGIANPPGGAVD